MAAHFPLHLDLFGFFFFFLFGGAVGQPCTHRLVERSITVRGWPHLKWKPRGGITDTQLHNMSTSRAEAHAASHLKRCPQRNQIHDPEQGFLGCRGV